MYHFRIKRVSRSREDKICFQIIPNGGPGIISSYNKGHSMSQWIELPTQRIGSLARIPWSKKNLWSGILMCGIFWVSLAPLYSTIDYRMAKTVRCTVYSMRYKSVAAFLRGRTTENLSQTSIPDCSTKRNKITLHYTTLNPWGK